MARDDGPANIGVKTALVIVGVFLAGAGVGAGVYHWARPRHPPPPPMGLPLRELGLSAEQETKVDEIMEHHRAELDAILHETFPKVRAVQEQIEREVRALLTIEQQRKLDELKARRPPPPHDGQPPHGPPPPFGLPGMMPPPPGAPPPPAPR